MFAENLRTLRTKKGWTQKELGEKVGREQAVVSAWELGAYEPDLETLKRIAAALSCSVHKLLKNGFNNGSQEEPRSQQ